MVVLGGMSCFFMSEVTLFLRCIKKETEIASSVEEALVPPRCRGREVTFQV